MVDTHILIIFIVLKKLYFILIFTIGLTFTNFAQTKSTGSVDPIAKLVKFYPNPATTVINFEFQRLYEKSYTFQVYNFMGKKVIELKSPSLKFFLPLQDFFRGVYIYQIRDKNGVIVESGKFQKL